MRKAGYRPRLSEAEQLLIEQHRANNIENILIIGDLHEPFCLDGYLQFCINTYHHYKCTDVIFIGDIIDNHFSSYHETSPDGLGGVGQW